jgi:hypothetical protein
VESDDDTWSGDEMLSLFVVTIFVTDRGDEAFAHQAAGDERSAVIVHFLQQLLAAIVDETNATEVDQKGRPLFWRFVPAFVQLVNTRAHELSLQHKPRVCCLAVTTNSYKFISHAPSPVQFACRKYFTLSSRKDAKEAKEILTTLCVLCHLCVFA